LDIAEDSDTRNPNGRRQQGVLDEILATLLAHQPEQEAQDLGIKHVNTGFAKAVTSGPHR
jgi:hypothetical protein